MLDFFVHSKQSQFQKYNIHCRKSFKDLMGKETHILLYHEKNHKTFPLRKKHIFSLQQVEKSSHRKVCNLSLSFQEFIPLKLGCLDYAVARRAQRQWRLVCCAGAGGLSVGCALVSRRKHRAFGLAGSSQLSCGIC